MNSKQDIRTIATNINAKKVIKVDVYDNFGELSTIQKEWDSFVESVCGDIFLTYDWCRVWWKYYGAGRKLRIFIFHNTNDELVGIIPFFFETLWLGPVFLRVVKIVSSDSTEDQVSLPIHSEYIMPVVQRLYELLMKDKLDVLLIGPIAGLYEHYEALNAACKKIFGHSHLLLSENKGVQTYFKLTNSWEKQLVELKKKQRQTVRRNYRKIRNEGYSLVARFVGVEHFTEKFSKFTKMHQLHWRKRHKLGHFGDWPASLEFHREVARSMLSHGRLRLLEVSAGNLCIGYQYAYKLGDKLYSLLSARSTTCKLANVAVGNVIYCEQMKASIRENVKYIDSMQGKYEHKLRLGGKLFPIYSIFIIKNNLSVLIRVSIFRIFSRFLHLSYYKIWFYRVAPRLPFKRRPLWKKWIRTHGLA